MKKIRIGFFGCGNMGSALASAIKSHLPNSEIFFYTPSKIKAESLAVQLGGVFVEDLSQMPKDLDWYFLLFKPQSLDEFNFSFSRNSKIVSVLAGVGVSRLVEKFKIEKIARLMPNTPSKLGLGANLLFLSSQFKSDEVEQISSVLHSTGKIFKMESESDLDLVTAFSGSGPALIFELARIFESELIKLTAGRVPAKEIIAQTFYGSGNLINSIVGVETNFADLRTQVTSKNGVTYEALQVLADKDIHGIFGEAFVAAYKRTIELSKEG